MQTIKINLDKVSDAEIELIVKYLQNGKVIAYPTDTVYGLGGDARDARAIKQINKIKGERRGKSFIWLISDYKMLKQYCLVNKEQEKYLKKIWPGPVTVVLDGKKNKNSLAVRLPKNDFLIKIISKAGFPIVSTSLNRTGKPVLTNVKNIEKYFKYLPDLIVGAGTIKGKQSRLVDIREMENIKVIRK
ncbi:MAG: L-threonylcarbamoyladenylate synthase [bacterium]|nr:L-threonylcarbamoyladenylate synthase [bacterium]